MYIAVYDPATGDLLGTQRLLMSIYQDINALSGTQKTAIWNDLSGGNPPKLSLSQGPNTAAIWALEYSASVPASLTATEKFEAKLRIMAMYTQDQPRYLENPPFDPTINIKGYV